MTRSVRTLIDGARGMAAGTGRPITVPTADELSELAAQLNQSMDERRAAEAAVAARQHRIRALADVNRSISQQLDLEPLLQQITRAVAQLTGAHNAVLWEADPAGQTLRRRAAATDPSVGSVDLPVVLTFEQGGAGWIARHRQALFVEDIATDARIVGATWALSHDLVTFAGAPVVAGDELLGVLTLNLKRGMLPQGDDRMLLSSFASQAAVAINNARLFAQAEARRRVAETLRGPRARPLPGARRQRRRAARGRRRLHVAGRAGVGAVPDRSGVGRPGLPRPLWRHRPRCRPIPDASQRHRGQRARHSRAPPGDDDGHY